MVPFKDLVSHVIFVHRETRLNLLSNSRSSRVALSETRLHVCGQEKINNFKQSFTKLVL